MLVENFSFLFYFWHSTCQLFILRSRRNVDRDTSFPIPSSKKKFQVPESWVARPTFFALRALFSSVENRKERESRQGDTEGCCHASHWNFRNRSSPSNEMLQISQTAWRDITFRSWTSHDDNNDAMKLRYFTESATLFFPPRKETKWRHGSSIWTLYLLHLARRALRSTTSRSEWRY